MALFGSSKKEKEIAEQKLKESLSKTSILDDIIFTLKEHMASNPWIMNCTGYYDSRFRTILVGPDLLGVINGSVDFEDGEPKEPKCEYLQFRYTDTGYKPLHSYRNAGGSLILDTNEVVEIWLNVIKDRLEVECPDIKFNLLSSEGKYAKLTYFVPSIEWKEWF